MTVVRTIEDADDATMDCIEITNAQEDTVTIYEDVVEISVCAAEGTVFRRLELTPAQLTAMAKWLAARVNQRAREKETPTDSNCGKCGGYESENHKCF